MLGTKALVSDCAEYLQKRREIIEFRFRETALAWFMKSIKNVNFRKFPVIAGIACTSVAMLVTACDSRSTTPPASGSAVDTSERMRDAANDAGDRVRDAAQRAARDAERTNGTTRDIKRAADDAADRTKDAVKDTSKAVERGAKDAAHDVGNALDKTGEDIQRATK